MNEVYYINEYKATRGDWGELAPERKSPQHHVTPTKMRNESKCTQYRNKQWAKSQAAYPS